ncbi:MAG: hypothetical protein R2764_19600 [Bacteroidales bacterium]
MEKDSTNLSTFFKFEDLRVYDKSLVYIDWVYNTFSMLPETYNRELYLKFVSSSQAIAFYISSRRFIFETKPVCLLFKIG